ncbi:MAG: H+/Na+-translocating ferredoxin:NAD+ oxidoreductase subunit [Clostridiales bacterium]|jgi:electron transport complex protein RnfA|nr:electron transport complex, RnfABCDGE type, subunit [Oscillospiraceae bacterium]MDN5378631.1 H+/Na+-translocating ferredoxin:NAD+ oxidoreductase subunit [Clostridiales bacterium]
MKELLAILLSAIIIDNFVLSKFMGICPFLGVSKKFESAIGMGIAVIFVMVCSTLVTYPFYMGILLPLKLGYLSNMSFILIIALFVQLIEIFLKKTMPALYKALGVYLPLITTNCAVLGVTLLNINNNLTFVQSIFNALGGGIGFTVALLLFSGVRSRLETCDIPETFKGVPSTLIAASIVSVSFMGFSGLIEGIFGK